MGNDLEKGFLFNQGKGTENPGQIGRMCLADKLTDIFRCPPAMQAA